MIVKGLSSLLAKANRLGNIDVTPAVENVTARVRDEARMRVPVDTAELKLSIDYKVEPYKDGIKGTVFTNKEHGAYVEFGTGPKGHEDHSGISPNISPTYSPDGWVYFDEDKQQFFYTRGYRARPFMYPALKDNEAKIQKALQTQIKKLIDEAIR